MGIAKHLGATKIHDIKLVVKYLEHENPKTPGKRKSAFEIEKMTAGMLKVSTVTVRLQSDPYSALQRNDRGIVYIVTHFH